MLNGSAVDGPLSLAVELATTRFVVQRVLMPIVIMFGVVANVINIAVLTRRSMKSSTNHYLSALAVYDVLYLALVFVIILRHYAAVASSASYSRYWLHVMWLSNTCSNTGVWLTVTFTVERYIGVCHPMRGKVWCTPSRARVIIIIVCIAAAIITFPEFFEFEVNITTAYAGACLQGGATSLMYTESKKENNSILYTTLTNLNISL